jgi:hypothetical protein
MLGITRVRRSHILFRQNVAYELGLPSHWLEEKPLQAGSVPAPRCKTTMQSRSIKVQSSCQSQALQAIRLQDHVTKDVRA